MKAKFLKKGILVAAILGTVLTPAYTTFAASNISLTDAVKEFNSVISVNAFNKALVEVKKESTVAETLAIKTTEEMQFEALFTNLAFAATEEYVPTYLLADETSEQVGKLYNMSPVEILPTEETVEGWALVQSGNVKGYVKSDDIVIGRNAIENAKQVLTEVYPDRDIITLTEEEIFEHFVVGETTEEEQARLAAEEAARIAAEKAAEEARIAAEKAAKLEKGNSVINYAKQFVGNPYVYGGTSLTRGTDCSGYVKSVYAHFGIYLPRTSYSMRSVGERVSYSEMQPGDIVCYSGHVALYMGNGKIVHAANARDGIKISGVNYAPILTIRRVL